MEKQHNDVVAGLKDDRRFLLALLSRAELEPITWRISQRLSAIRVADANDYLLQFVGDDRSASIIAAERDTDTKLVATD